MWKFVNLDRTKPKLLIVTFSKLSSDIFTVWKLMWTASSSRNLISAVSPTWRECSIKWDRCCRCCRSALGCLARWASFNAGTVKWVRDFSVLATRLAAALGRLRQQGLLKDGSVTAAGMPLLCPQRTRHGSHQHCSYTGLGSTVPPRSSNGLWIRGARTQLSYRCCHGLYYKCPAECLHMSLTFTIFLYTVIVQWNAKVVTENWCSCQKQFSNNFLQTKFSANFR